MSPLFPSRLPIAMLLVAGALAGAPPHAAAQSGSFTYQGRLELNGSPATDVSQLRLRLFDAPSGGNAVGPQLSFAPAIDGDGLFTITVPFSSLPTQDLDGLYAEFTIVSRTGTTTTISPRQRITAAPAAQIADTVRKGAWTELPGGVLSRDTTGAERFGLNTGTMINSSTFLTLDAPVSSSQFGGMYINTTPADGQPFYGFATNGLARGYIAFDDGNDSLDFVFSSPGGFRTLTLDANGNLGLNTDPLATLDVASGTFSNAFTRRIRSNQTSAFRRFSDTMLDEVSGALFQSRWLPEAGDYEFNWFPNESSGGVPVFRAEPGTGFMAFGSSTIPNARATFKGPGGVLPQNAALENDDVVIAGEDAVLGLYSTNSGSYGSAIALKEVDSAGNVVVGWGIVNESAAGGGDLLFTWGTSSNYAANALIMSLNNTGRVGIGVSTPGFRLELPNIGGTEGRGRANRWATYSSERFKTNIATVADPMTRLAALRGVEFDWKHEHGGTHDTGFIAEEVAAVFPDLVSLDEDGKPVSLDYARLLPVAVEAIKTQQAEIEAQRKTLEAQREALSSQREAIDELRAELRRLAERLDD